MEFIKGNIRQVIFSGETGFFVGTFKAKEVSDALNEIKNKVVVVTGLLIDPNLEDTYILQGEYVRHDRYGMQFQFKEYEKLMPEGIDAIVEFLSSPLIKGCGEKTAKSIVETLGDKTLDLIKEDISNLLLVPNMTEKKAKSIYESVLNYSAVDDTLVRLKSLGFTIPEATRLVKNYQDKVAVYLEENIYYFKEFVPFDKLDRIFKNNHDELDIVRQKECLVETMERISNKNGDIYYTKEELLSGLKSEFHIFISLEELDKVLDILKTSERVTIIDESIYLTKYYDMEFDIAHILKRMMSYPKKEIKNFAGKIKELQSILGVKYNNDQKEAILKALENPVSIISGGPGTGKTTIVNAITKLYIDIYKLSPIDTITSIALLAPTGRAAKKLSTSTNLPASTIHRYLKWNKDTDDFAINENNKNRHKLIIVDETSMIDEYLFVSLLKGIEEKAQIVFVGDTFQLPSVGAGLVLNDLVNSKLFPFTSLETIYRQSDNSYIPILAKEIKDHEIGEDFDLKKDDYNFIPCESRNLKEMLKQIIHKSIAKGLKADDVQILAPMYKGENGIDNLNVLLQDIFNPRTEEKREFIYIDVTYREKDKVLQLVNNPDCNVYNGDIGYIESIEEKTYPKKHLEMTINFDGNRVIYGKEDLASIKHAYAITIHKSQGSEFAHVILPISKSYYKMLYNKLIYTGVSRAKKSLIIIGEEPSFKMAVLNDYSTNRKTSLKESLMYTFTKKR